MPSMRKNKVTQNEQTKFLLQGGQIDWNVMSSHFAYGGEREIPGAKFGHSVLLLGIRRSFSVLFTLLLLCCCEFLSFLFSPLFPPLSF